MVSFGDNIKLVGGILGLAAFVWNLWVAVRAYLVLGIEVREAEGSDPIVKLTITNPGLTSKIISYAALIVSPESFTLAEAGKQLVGAVSGAQKSGPKKSYGGKSPSAMVVLYRRAGANPIQQGDCLLVPLRELYWDQSKVGPGETVSHACSLKLPPRPDSPIMIVRFIVFISYAGLYLRWRYTAEALRAPRLYVPPLPD